MDKNNGWIKTARISLTPPSLKDNTADVDRFRAGVERTLRITRVRMELPILKRLPGLLRENDYSLEAVAAKDGSDWRLVDVFSKKESKGCFGVAVDLGTSTIVVRLVDLEARETVEEESFLNPQVEFGEDVLTRIHFASRDDGLATLQGVLLEKLNKEIQALVEARNASLRHVVGASVAGNTTMTHLFLGLNPFWICREPYIPAVNRTDLIRASQIGLTINKEALVLVFPNVGSYFGGDLIAGIIASSMDHLEDVSILVDVGTNAEVVLGNRDWLMACAGAAGPALEGGVARMGMMAAPGAIDHVSLKADGTLETGTIGGVAPIGICGSGLIDLVSCLFLNGMLDMRGKFVPEACGERLADLDGLRAFTVVPAEESGSGQALRLSQPDVDALMRSKAAMYTILTTITSMVGMGLNEMARFFVAGTFGSYIDPRSAINIGMIPDLPLEAYVSLGNTSLEGATIGLLDEETLERIHNIRDRITYIELNVNQEFMNLFSAAKFIPHTDRSLFPSVERLQRQLRSIGA